MAANDHSNGGEHPTFYTNQQLFSDYYLKERMAGHREWSEESVNLKVAFEKALAIYREAKASLTNANEAQTEDDFIKPIFSEVLALHYDVQPTATRQGKRNRPDYALFTTEEKARAAKQVRDDEGKYYAQTKLVADAKYWSRPLDTAGDAGREELSNTNPSFQIVNYLVATGAEWGVLTNGAQWRLYATRARETLIFSALLSHKRNPLRELLRPGGDRTPAGFPDGVFRDQGRAGPDH
jgi:hypothetical protein